MEGERENNGLCGRRGGGREGKGGLNPLGPDSYPYLLNIVLFSITNKPIYTKKVLNTVFN